MMISNAAGTSDTSNERLHLELVTKNKYKKYYKASKA